MSDEKPYEATPSRLAQARRRGDVPRSPEFNAVAAFALALVAAAAVVAPIGAAVTRMLGAAARGSFDAQAAAIVAVLMLLPALCAAVGASGASLAQAGGLRFTAPKIDLARLAPGTQLQRMFSRESAGTAVRGAIAFALTVAVLAPAALVLAVAGGRSAGSAALASAAWGTVLRIAWTACAVGGLFAALDFGFAHARWKKRLRMSHDEARRDSKEHDGDPVARGRRRALHRRISRAAVQRVKEAAFVVTNPTHLAIALAYRPPEIPVPRVLVRAADDAAAEVRRLAQAHGVPLIENVPLARTLYATTRAGEYAPPETYLALAEIVAALAHAQERA